MTRKEEVEKHLQKIGKGEDEFTPFDAGFECGVEWADINRHWISVGDELPATKYYDDEDDPYEGLLISLPVVVLLDDGTIHIASLNQNYDECTGKEEGNPYWFDENNRDNGDWLNTHVTHWFPLPVLPKGGEQ